ncbi:MAG: hypothetical protein M1827_003164 [Pycnora praestabilis]|nr:MAG: hypothetical protein M1827_003164 [Pycnora praestabilis]
MSRIARISKPSWMQAAEENERFWRTTQDDQSQSMLDEQQNVVSSFNRENSNMASDAIRRLASDESTQSAPVPGIDLVPTWMREAHFKLEPLGSRASSIMSTRTKTSIATLHDDTHSGFEIPLGNRTYKFGLDGSIIPSVHSVPRYPAFVLPTFEDTEAPNEGIFGVSTPANDSELITQRHHADVELDRSGSAPPSSTLGHVSPDNSGVSRNPSFTPGKETVSVQKRHASSSSVPTITTSPAESDTSANTTLRRSNGVRLKLKTRALGGQTGDNISPRTPNTAVSSTSTNSRDTVSAGARSARDGRAVEPLSPNFIGKGAAGVFPPIQKEGYIQQERVSPTGRSLSQAGENRNVKQFAAFALPPVSAAFSAETTRSNFTAVSSPSNGLGLSSPHERETGVLANSPWIHSEDKDHDQHNLVPQSPVHIDDGPIGTHPPPSMESENDISIHYSRLVRSIDLSHREQLQAREFEISETRSMINGLAREVSNLKTELVKTKSRVRHIADSKDPPKSKEDTTEAKAFAFPPLKLNHVHTLKMALKRRAEKIRQGFEGDAHEPPDTPGNSTPTSDSPSISDSASPGEQGSSHQAMINGNTVISPLVEERDVRRPSEVQRIVNQDLSTGVHAFQHAFHTLRESPFYWMGRSNSGTSRERGSVPNVTTRPIEDQYKTILDQVRKEVDDMWEIRWKERDSQLMERMKRIELESQNAIGRAIVERDKAWTETWAKQQKQLQETVRQKNMEIMGLKTWIVNSHSELLQSQTS